MRAFARTIGAEVKQAKPTQAASPPSPLAVVIPGSLEKDGAPGWRRRRKETAAGRVQCCRSGSARKFSARQQRPIVVLKQALGLLEEALVPPLPSRRQSRGYISFGEVKEMLRDRRRVKTNVERGRLAE
jgi:hypothetical protein